MWWRLFHAKYVIANMHSLEQNKKKKKQKNKTWHLWNTQIPVFRSVFLIAPATNQTKRTPTLARKLLWTTAVDPRTRFQPRLRGPQPWPLSAIFKGLPSPRFAGGVRELQSAPRNERGGGTLFMRPECKTYPGSASAPNQPGLRDTLGWKKAGRMGTWREKQRQILGMDVTESNSRQIRLGKATFMQVTSHSPIFNIQRGGRNIDD